jgi:hypothetical protein
LNGVAEDFGNLGDRHSLGQQQGSRVVAELMDAGGFTGGSDPTGAQRPMPSRLVEGNVIPFPANRAPVKHHL